LLKPESIQKGLASIFEGHDSSFSVRKIQTFAWYDDKPLNYMTSYVPRTQDINPIFVETSGFYIFKREVLRQGKRVGTNPKMICVDSKEAMDIDEEEDFLVCKAIMEFDQTSHQ
jgi:CMP-N-acetylneuraminic acid synthetase